MVLNVAQKTELKHLRIAYYLVDCGQAQACTQENSRTKHCQLQCSSSTGELHTIVNERQAMHKGETAAT